MSPRSLAQADRVRPPRIGRPRDSTIDARALEATRRLLLEEGLTATTVQAVAKRSGVHASAIYRRWPTRVDLLHDAAFADHPPGRIRPSGDLRRDLGRFVRAYIATFELPVVRAAMPAIIAARGSDGPTPRLLVNLSVRPQFRDIIAAAPDGAVDGAIEADQVFDLLLGAVLVRALVPDDVRSPTSIDDTVELLMRVLEPRR